MGFFVAEQAAMPRARGTARRPRHHGHGEVGERVGDLVRGWHQLSAAVATPFQPADILRPVPVCQVSAHG